MPRIRALLASLLLLLVVPIHASSGEGEIVNDVTRLNPIAVDRVIAPAWIDEIVEAVRAHPGPVSIGGGRFSQGGQTATEGSLHIDMRGFDRILDFSKERKRITVQTGITWRKIQEHIDPHDLSVKIMQSYASFTVGGSLSVNCHGRYVGQGPIVQSVESIRVVLADGTLVEASPEENSEVFHGAIGGYGALGVIAEATLSLTDNVRIERQNDVMPLSAYREFFDRNVGGNTGMIFHNADIYPNAYDTVRVISYVKTDKPVTVEDRLRPPDESYWTDRMAMRIITEWPFGKTLREHLIDPLVYRGDEVKWRNYEASYDVKSLEPVSRRSTTYVLQEYFIPIDRLETFAASLAGILNRHHVNTVNVSIRHATKDPGTLLAWARDEVFAFVLYYKQGTGAADREAVGVWTRELIDAAIATGGTYYLPYQIHATHEQFLKAYPRAGEFFALKKRLDPTNKFRNKLWDAYYPARKPTAVARKPIQAAPPAGRPPTGVAALIQKTLESTEGYARDEAQTYLTLPEWLLVYYPGEYAEFLEHKPASDYPYFGSIGQFWSGYEAVYQATRDYPFNWGYHVMVMVIGTSYTVENGLKGLYENTVGRASWWLAGGEATQEDTFAAEVASRYVDFIHETPWYEFPYLGTLKQLWAETDLFGPDIVRKWERKLGLSAEYLVKAQYALIIRLASKAAYGETEDTILAVATSVSPEAIQAAPGVKSVGEFRGGWAILSLPRYDAFRHSVQRLAEQGVLFKEIAGNDEILMTILVPADWQDDLKVGTILFEKPVLTDPDRKRVALVVPVPSLHQVMIEMANRDLAIEHVYDY